MSTTGTVKREPNKLTRKDFVSDQEVRWCPGCGDYSILAQTQKILPTLGLPREKFVFVSGIGCSSRFPYYMNTYGFHTVHGRAPAVATGLKCARPDLSVWVVTGDGDALSIGGNHFLHAIRRNIDINIILFNNRIYGLTKGQYSPTSELGKRTKSTPMGSIDNPLNPLCVAIAAEATFAARTVATYTTHLAAVLEAAGRHKGTSFVEVYQNCNIFNDGAFDHFTAREVRDDRTVLLEHEKPLVFGKDHDKAIRLKGTGLEVVPYEPGKEIEGLLVHDEEGPEYIAYLLARIDYPEFPVPLGIFRRAERPTYEDLLSAQTDLAIEEFGEGDIEDLFHSGETWEIS